MIIKKKAEYEWVGTLALVAGAVWWAVPLVADGLQGGAILDTLGDAADPTITRALVEGALLIFNGSIAFAVAGLFMGVAGYAILGTGALPRWTGWFGWVSAGLCVAAVPSMFVGSVNHNTFYNVAGWGPMFIANLPPLFWFLAVGLYMIKIASQPQGSEGTAPTLLNVFVWAPPFLMTIFPRRPFPLE